ncbi:MAG: branched-chain amino acid ABC transporter substrate-binding protein [Betaproteobacteria bacterium RIFCSPHIGHO2_12_FULL_69_13]|nr:MAG: branched-chain amino acid ABC transporter substrate-binding protein [Betaproteobacteria bacterium RIFCSPHIGHO2_12_FULL_69_13]OGA64515.1 MAG: branched-chain amino acid ABC transporter substrate-binding protein [Betaproteobacteria bacterium RIFCSPLOWO2_12_FULL_68_20]
MTHSRRKWLLISVALAAAAALAAPLAHAQQKPIKIGFSMALTGGLAGGGKGALISMEIWRDDVNKKGGLLGRPVALVYYDDATQPANVPGIYTKLLEVDKVDLVVSGYGTNLIAPAMPIIMRKKLVFPALFGLGANEEFKYDRYFQIMPAGPAPKLDWSKGFFELAMEQNPKPKSVAIVAADAEFALNAAEGARANAKKLKLDIVYDKTYPPATTDFTPIVRAIQATSPDIVYVGSYPPDSVGMVKAASEVGLKTKMFGGGMVGLQFAAIQKNLGPLLNGIVNYDFWVPEPTLNFPGVNEFLAKYRVAAKDKGVDPFGHYLPPYSYAYLEVLGQAVEATKSLDHSKLAAYMHKTTFDTVVGKVKFGKNGEWARTRTLQVQFRDVQPDNLEQFAGPGKRIVLYPKEWKSGNIVFPYKQ